VVVWFWSIYLEYVVVIYYGSMSDNLVVVLYVVGVVVVFYGSILR